jgi:hypothetical protein
MVSNGTEGTDIDAGRKLCAPADHCGWVNVCCPFFFQSRILSRKSEPLVRVWEIRPCRENDESPSDQRSATPRGVQALGKDLYGIQWAPLHVFVKTHNTKAKS